ncbi:MAG: gamma-glutamyl-gamma-aminobutyrate hydrolase family protein, partial [Pseudomonadales bacterium]
MNTPIIGVTGSSKRWSPSWWCIRTALFLTGCRAHRISVLRPNIPRNIDGFVISGGDDIHPHLYDKAPPDAEGDFDPERDQLEITCINHALESGKPLLGICRGAQLINVVLGGDLHQDINPLRKITSRRAHLAPLKTILLERQSHIAEAVKRKRLKVNSLHNQAVRNLGKGLCCVGRDKDDIIQAFESEAGVIGVQWHP